MLIAGDYFIIPFFTFREPHVSFVRRPMSNTWFLGDHKEYACLEEECAADEFESIQKGL
jgi:hypothetical protein